MEMDDVAIGNVMDRGKRYGGEDNENNWNEITLGDRKVISVRTFAANGFHPKSYSSSFKTDKTKRRFNDKHSKSKKKREVKPKQKKTPSSVAKKKKTTTKKKKSSSNKKKLLKKKKKKN